MNKFLHIFFVFFALTLTNNVLSEQSVTANKLTQSEVQAYVEGLFVEGFLVDEIISSAFEMGIPLELLASVLLDLGVSVADVATGFVREGVTASRSALALVAVVGNEALPQIKEAIEKVADAEAMKTFEVDLAILIEGTKTEEKTDPAKILVYVEPTPPIMGGGGGITRQ